MPDYEKIQNALKRMDPKNDNHWTMQGEAKLDTVKFLSGGEVVTRDELNGIAPGFNREAMAAFVANSSEATNGGQIAPAVGPGTGPTIKSESPKMEDGPSGGETQVEALASQIRDADEEIQQCQRVQAEMTARIIEIQDVRQKLEAKLGKIKPPKTHMANIQLYLESTKETMRRRGEARRTVANSALDLNALQEVLSPSPIDQALKSRQRQ